MIPRKTLFVILNGLILPYIVFFFTISLMADEKSDNKTNDRQLTLQKILEIKETGDSFYFKYPSRVFADMEENIYICDTNRLLKFSKKGVFIKNLINAGQGPGEVTSLNNVHFVMDKIIIYNKTPSKIIWIDKEGTLEKEFCIERMHGEKFSHYYEDHYYFFQTQYPSGKSIDAYMDVDQKFIRISCPETMKRIKPEGFQPRLRYSFHIMYLI
jgi:hypothetical protein